VETVVSNGWPTDPADVKGVRAIVLHTRLGGTVLLRGVRTTPPRALRRSRLCSSAAPRTP
jgi:hypothetical protein